MKLGSLIFLSACFVLFQNMSPSDEFDIRTIAPTKPEGFDQYSYFPSQFHGGSASQLGQEILDHNFGERLQALQFELEVQGGRWGIGPQAQSSRGPASIKPATDHSGGAPSSQSTFRFGHRGGDRFGFLLESAFNLRCDYSAGSKRLEVSLNRNLTPRTEVSFKHTSDDQQSSLNLNYQW